MTTSRRYALFFRSQTFDILLFLLLVILLVAFLLYSAARLEYSWDWAAVPHYLLQKSEDGWQLGALLTGLLITLKISAVGLLLAFAIGLATALFRRSSAPVGRFFAALYLELSRNTPLLIQIYCIYFVLGPILGLSRFTAAVLALGLFDGAYAAEIFRSGIEAVGRGQYEAAQSIGLSMWAMYRHIIVPQAVRKILPPLTSQSISLIKDSALVSAIALYDLTYEAQRIIAETYMTFEIWFVTAVLYLLITMSLSFFVSFLEKRLRI